MNENSLKLVTVVVERIIRDRVVADLRRLGARGHTLTDVSGEGSRGVRASEWEGSNVKIEAVVSPTVAEAIIDHIAATYFENFAVIVYAQDVQVVRGDKYV